MLNNKYVYLCGLLLIIFGTVFAAYQSYPIKTPALTGLVTYTDYDMLRPTDALSLQNTLIDNRIGRVERGKAIRTKGFNSTNQKLYSADSYYESYRSLTQLIGLTGQRDSILKDIDPISPPPGPNPPEFQVIANDVINVIGYSTLNKYDIGAAGDVVSGKDTGFVHYPIIVGREVQFLDSEWGKIIYNKNSTPYLYTPYSSFDNNVPHQKDTLGFGPRVVSLSLEAPGQPRVSLYPATSDKKGWFRYIYGYAGTYGNRSFPSRWIYLEGTSAMLSLFEINAADSTSGYGKTNLIIHIARQRFGGGWQDLDSVTIRGPAEFYFIDSLDLADSDTLSQDIDYSTPYPKNEPYFIFEGVNNVPGGLYWNGDYDANHQSNSGNSFAELPRTVDTSTNGGYYFIGYSYYDPITMQESPLGPITLGQLHTLHSGNFELTGWRKGYTLTQLRPPYIRIYRSAESYASYSDAHWQQPSTMYCVAQVKANRPYQEDTTVYRNVVFPGWGTDDQVSLGMGDHFDTLTADYPYKEDDFVYSSEGGGIVIPPYVENLEIVFTSMAYSNNRYWGVGSPLYPSRLYYSNYSDPYQWGAFNSLELFDDGNSDKLVALQTLPSGNNTILYAFKQNAIYAVAGYDAEFDLTYYPVSLEIGAVNSRTCIAAEDMILFLAPDLNIYELRNGTKPKNLTLGIHDVVSKMFHSYDSAKVRAIAYRYDNYICFADTSNADTVLAYDHINQIWNKIGNRESIDVLQTFQYDTLGVGGEASDDWWLLTTANMELFKKSNSYYNSSVSGVVTALAFEYRTPYVTSEDYMVQIEQVNFTGYWGIDDDLTLRIIDQHGDTLVTKALVYSAAKNNSFSIGFGINEGQHLAVDFSTAVLTSSAALDVDSVWISDIDIKWRRIGKNAID